MSTQLNNNYVKLSSFIIQNRIVKSGRISGCTGYLVDPYMYAASSVLGVLYRTTTLIAVTQRRWKSSVARSAPACTAN